MLEVPMIALDGEAASGSMSQTMLNNIVTFALPIIGIAMAAFVIYMSIQMHKGAEGASWKKLALGVVAFLVVGALLVLAKNMSSTATTVSTTVQNYGKQVQQEADKLIK